MAAIKQQIFTQDEALTKSATALDDKIFKLDEYISSNTKEVKSGNLDKNEFKASVKKINKDIEEETKAVNKEFEAMNELKKQSGVKELRIEAKQKIASIKLQIKEEISNLNNGVTDKDKIKRNKNKVKEAHKKELLDAKNEYLTLSPNVGKKTIALIFIVLSLLAVVIGLTINYTVYYPNTVIEATKTEPEHLQGPYPFGETQGYVAVILCVLLLIAGTIVSILLLKDGTKRLAAERKNNTFAKGMLIGFITDFFDTIGVGSFAPTVVLVKAMKANDDDKKLPGILNIGHTIPVIFEAAIFIAAVKVDIPTLVVLIAMAAIGSFIGAKLVNKVNKLMIKLIMGIVLFITAIMMLASHPLIPGHIGSGGGKAEGLAFDDWKMYVTAVIFLVLGALMSFGVGLYAPAMAVVTLMGMSADVAFPIMMGSTAFLMPAGSIQFIKDKNYAPKLTLGISIGGTAGALAAFLIVFVGITIGAGVKKDDFVNYLLFLVIAVVFYASFSMLYEYYRAKKPKQPKQKLTTK